MQTISLEALIGPCDSTASDLFEKRREIIDLSDACLQAAIAPSDPGGIGHGLRWALALRMARLHSIDELVDVLEASEPEQEVSDILGSIAVGREAAGADLRVRAIVAHADMLANEPRAATKQCIVKLVEAGVEQADIVRLSEFVGVLSYYMRVVAGVKLLTGRA